MPIIFVCRILNFAAKVSPLYGYDLTDFMKTPAPSNYS
jgi:hypothetical protein